MTTRLIVHNDDQSRAVRGTLHDIGSPTPQSTDIPPGEQREFWIHSGRTLTILELPLPSGG